jgi:hypothetical protein
MADVGQEGKKLQSYPHLLRRAVKALEDLPQVGSNIRF